MSCLRLASVLCAITTMVILVAGLGPFHAPPNKVTWEANHKGVLFGEYGTVLSQRPFAFPDAHEPFTIEVWLAPYLIDDANTFLAFYDPFSKLQFSLHQLGTSVGVRREQLGRGGEVVSKWIVSDKVFRSRQLTFVALRCDAGGSEIFVEGKYASASKDFRVSLGDLQNRTIVLDAPISTSSFGGVWRGLAIYASALSANRIQAHREAWVTRGDPSVVTDDRALAVFRFDEGSGDVVHNRVTSQITNLTIPSRYLVVDKTILAAPQFTGWSDLVVNIAGFVPFGFLILARVEGMLRTKQIAVLAAILAGFVLSFLLEFLQGFLPTRDSTVTDIITNTSGTVLGTLLYGWKPARVLFWALLCRPKEYAFARHPMPIANSDTEVL